MSYDPTLVLKFNLYLKTSTRVSISLTSQPTILYEFDLLRTTLGQQSLSTAIITLFYNTFLFVRTAPSRRTDNTSTLNSQVYKRLFSLNNLKQSVLQLYYLKCCKRVGKSSITSSTLYQTLKSSCFNL